MAVCAQRHFASDCQSGQKIPQDLRHDSAAIVASCSLLRSRLKINRLQWGWKGGFSDAPLSGPSVTATAPLLRYSGVQGSGWIKNVKERYFEVNKRQKIALALTAGQEKDQAGDFQGGPVV